MSKRSVVDDVNRRKVKVKSKAECQSWQEWEGELSRYAGSLLGCDDYYMGLPSKVLLMPEEEGREYVRDMLLTDLLAQLLDFLSATDKKAKRLVLETEEGEYAIWN